MSAPTSTATPRGPVEIDWDAFERITADMGYTNDAARARALDVNHTVISRLRSGRNKPGTKVIANTIALGIQFGDVFKRAAR